MLTAADDAVARSGGRNGRNDDAGGLNSQPEGSLLVSERHTRVAALDSMKVVSEMVSAGDAMALSTSSAGVASPKHGD